MWQFSKLRAESRGRSNCFFLHKRRTDEESSLLSAPISESAFFFLFFINMYTHLELPLSSQQQSTWTNTQAWKNEAHTSHITPQYLTQDDTYHPPKASCILYYAKLLMGKVLEKALSKQQQTFFLNILPWSKKLMTACFKWESILFFFLNKAGGQCDVQTKRSILNQCRRLWGVVISYVMCHL